MTMLFTSINQTVLPQNNLLVIYSWKLYFNVQGVNTISVCLCIFKTSLLLSEAVLCCVP